jgi:tetratricopeptide (TPR) repeat protein
VRSLFSFLALAWLSAASPAQQEIPERTFLVELGEPGLAVEVNGQETVTDDHGTLRFTVRVGAGGFLRFRSADPAWTLNVVRTAPVDDPAIPVLWDLTSELHRVEPPPEATGVDPCDGRRSLHCRQAMWSRFERALERRDCRRAIDALADLEREYPELLTGADSVTAFATAYLDCGLAADDDLMVRRAVDLLASQGEGEMWCGVAESRLLARGYEALDELATAAEGAAAARPLCAASRHGDDRPALEWEFYFRYRLGAWERAAALAEAATGRLGLFLTAWLDLARGECGTEVEAEPSGDLPCRGLPQDFCSRQYGRILLACGTDTADFEAASTYLAAALPVDPAAWDEILAGDGRQLVLELAEAEVLAGDHAEAIRLYERLLEDVTEAQADGAERAKLYRLYGDALLSSSVEDDTVVAALSAYELARRELDGDPVAFAIVMNNICVLRGRLPEPTDPDRIASDLTTLEAALRDVPEEEDRLRLGLTRNLFSLRIRRLEKETGLDTPERLARLQELRGPFMEYQRELEALNEDELGLPAAPLGGPGGTAGDGAALERIRQGGRRFAVALP